VRISSECDTNDRQAASRLAYERVNQTMFLNHRDLNASSAASVENSGGKPLARVNSSAGVRDALGVAGRVSDEQHLCDLFDGHLGRVGQQTNLAVEVGVA
jgi:hypothetical protein